MSRSTTPLSLAVFLSCAVTAAATAAEPVPQQVQSFLEHTCSDCHAQGAEEGGFQFAQLALGAEPGRKSIDQWTRVFDRVASGEMPPAEAEQPEAKARQAFLTALEPWLSDVHAAGRETVLRRLNREEYQNTIADLLQVEVDLRELLPADQQAGGFDNNGAALAVSAELMGRYLQAAEQAIDAAIVKGPRPESNTFTVSSVREVKRYVPKQYGLIGDHVVLYKTNSTQYSKLSTRDQRLPESGRYRFQFEAAVHAGSEPIVFSVVASDFAGTDAQVKHLGYLEATLTEQTFELEANLVKGSAIQFFALGLPSYVKDASTGEHPGVGIGPVTITGPLTDRWPPASHTSLLGNVDLASGTAADASRLLAPFMRKAFRRSVTEAEVDRYVAFLENRMATGRTFEQSLRGSLAAVLCSPHFLYLHEQQSATEKSPEQEISAHERATRLSYFLWSSLPDDQLAQLADSGKLLQAEVLHAQVERMLADPKAERFITNFTGQWLRLRDIRETNPDRKLYPEFDELLQHSMVAESQGFFRELLRSDGNLDNFLDSDFAMLNRRLATHYGIEGVEGLEVQRVPLPADSVRGGVLTQAAVLKVTANGTNTSPVTRGVWVLENILGQGTPPPPPNIAGIEPDIRGATTLRQKLEQHRNVESCQVCHRHIDPPGFALESFDPVGALREKYYRFVVNPDFVDKGWGKVQPVAEVDSSGTMIDGRSFDDIEEFKQLLLDHRRQFADCLTEKLMTYALGRELGFSDRQAVEEIVRTTAAQGNGLRTLIHEIVGHRAFMTH